MFLSFVFRSLVTHEHTHMFKSTRSWIPKRSLSSFSPQMWVLVTYSLLTFTVKVCMTFLPRVTALGKTEDFQIFFKGTYSYEAFLSVYKTYSILDVSTKNNNVSSRFTFCDFHLSEHISLVCGIKSCLFHRLTAHISTMKLHNAAFTCSHCELWF